MIELLLPRTDEGALVQAVVLAVVVVLVLFGVRRDREIRLLVIGIAVVTAAFMAVRALH